MKNESQFRGIMEYIYDVNSKTFQDLITQKSYEKPVAVDFRSPWRTPYRTLKPILEKLTESLGGAVVLAKLNTEEEPAPDILSNSCELNS